MAAGQYTLTEAFPDRFLLGLGGHRSPRQSSDPRPLDTLRSYLDAMDQAPFGLQPNRVLAALGPQALRLSASHASGAHTYFVPVEHTAQARSLLGPEPFLAVEQAVVLGNNRDLARDHVTSYMIARHQTNNLRASASPTPIWPVATAWSTPSPSSGTWTLSPHACASTWTLVPTTSASRCSPRTPAASPSPSGASWPR
jgi:hypothetical protein